MKLKREDLVQLGALPAAYDEPNLLVGDERLLASKLKWRPIYDLDRGLDETIHWWQERMLDGSPARA